MTSIVTGLGVLPLAIGMADPGREIESPMAVVTLGGLLSPMALNFLVLPTLALRCGRFEPGDIDVGRFGLIDQVSRQRGATDRHRAEPKVPEPVDSSRTYCRP
jgi:hypothetical protein